MRKIPQQYAMFPCTEYFQDYVDGRYDVDGHVWFIYPLDQIEIDEDGGFAIGRPGWDSILFCYREGIEGIWAYYPMEREWVWKAATLKELEEKWYASMITF